MFSFYLTKIQIEKVRHLENIIIPLESNEKKHLILTGKNGSGKTSVLEALSGQLNYLATKGDFTERQALKSIYDAQLKEPSKSENDKADVKKRLARFEKEEDAARNGLELKFNIPINSIKAHFDQSDFVLAFYQATRVFEAEIPRHVEKVQLKDQYTIKESPRKEFIKYILDLKMTEALAMTSGNNERAEKIHNWFSHFDGLLKQIYQDDSIRMDFNMDTFEFTIHQDHREPFSFNELSDGYAAILDIVVDLMVRMEKHLNEGLKFDLPGIVLIDEIETHLHLEMQKNVLGFLENVFPNIQFIVTTHSPFVLSGTKNAVVYDLENHTLVKDGLTDLPYDGIVEGYFKADALSKELRNKFNRYQALVNKEILTDEEMEDISNLELYLDEIPDYLALGVTTEYRRLKAAFEAREDL